MEGSGFEEIILESGICANGSLQGVMSGKHYNRALRIHATLVEALDRLLWSEFSMKFNVTDKLKSIANEMKIHGICSNLLDIDSLQNGEDLKSLIQDYENERHKIRTGERGLTQQFWMNYIDNVWNVLNLLRAVKTNDFTQYKTCLKAMVPLFFSMDQQNYARYLSLYVANLNAIDDTHPEAAKCIRECALSVRRVNRPASGIPVDQTIEQTINQSAKSCGGIIGMSRNTQAYDRWCLTRHERAIYAVRAFSWVNMYDAKDALGKRNRESEIVRSLNDVEKATEAIKNFSNAFDSLQDEDLMCLSSGKTIPKETAKTITDMNTSGMTAYQNFVNERLKTGKTSFFAPIKRQNLTTFGSLKKVVKVRTSADKTIKVVAQRNVCAQALMLCHEHNIDVQRVFSYPMGPIPWALASKDCHRISEGG
ncbi:hypothetical protein PoB_006985100 [Plakobranchus ocellatus]|uniref:Uncharacterized protein n=1 Tax=Plakobranchus ocellatus TaxID=259542 RepID=A0AAV4DGS7_9GAST|nr:hypothetical protein PoB_006985100 [Plakobranchus ocellatus]